jgi:hypothetical protein
MAVSNHQGINVVVLVQLTGIFPNNTSPKWWLQESYQGFYDGGAMQVPSGTWSRRLFWRGSRRWLVLRQFYDILFRVVPGLSSSHTGSALTRAEGLAIKGW